MDSASDEINLLLPLVFGLIVILFLFFCGLIGWLLRRFEIIEFPDNLFPFRILKGVFLSFIGVFALFITINLLVFVIDSIIGFFKT